MKKIILSSKSLVKTLIFCLIILISNTIISNAEIINIGKIQLNIEPPKGYIDVTNNVPDGILNMFSKLNMRLLKRYEKYNSNDELDSFYHIAIDNNVINIKATNDEVQEFFDELDETKDNEIDEIFKKGKDLAKEINENIAINDIVNLEKIRTDNSFSIISASKMIDQSTNKNILSVYESTFLHAADSIIMVYSYSNAYDFNVKKHIQKVKAQAKEMKEYLLKNNPNTYEKPRKKKTSFIEKIIKGGVKGIGIAIILGIIFIITKLAKMLFNHFKNKLNS